MGAATEAAPQSEGSARESGDSGRDANCDPEVLAHSASNSLLLGWCGYRRYRPAGTGRCDAALELCASYKARAAAAEMTRSLLRAVRTFAAWAENPGAEKLQLLLPSRQATGTLCLLAASEHGSIPRPAEHTAHTQIIARCWQPSERLWAV